MSTAKPKLVEIPKANGQESKRKRGAAQLEDAVDMILDRDCIDVAEAISTKSKSGDTTSAKFLYSLAKSAREQAEDEEELNYPSMAQLLANSPPWQGDPEPKKLDDDDFTADD